MLQFLEQLETLLLICWACTASLAFLGWIILSAATGETFPEGLSKKRDQIADYIPCDGVSTVDLTPTFSTIQETLHLVSGKVECY